MDISVGDIIRIKISVTLPGGTTGVTTATFDDTNFQVLSVPTSKTLTIQAATVQTLRNFFRRISY